MRISDIMRLGKSAIIFATIVVAFLAIIWLLGYKMIYKKILHGKKQISIGRIGLVCVREFDSWIIQKVLAGRIKPAFLCQFFRFLYCYFMLLYDIIRGGRDDIWIFT